MLLGLAIGDSLGITTESLIPSARSERHGEIRDYLPNRHNGDPRGYPSDDTQLSAWTLEQLLEDGRINPEALGARFASHRIIGIGSTVRAFSVNWKSGLNWRECGPASAGNGALMRIAPVLLPHLAVGNCELWADVVLASALTHNDYTSTSACLAFTAMLWELLAMDAPPPSIWWETRYVELAADLEGDVDLHTRGGAFPEWQGPLWRFVQDNLPWARRQGLTARQACDSWYSGAYLLETVPCVLYILSRHAGDPEEAIVRAVNDTRDNDTVAAIVGAAVGALHGASALPRRWRDGLTGCVNLDNGTPTDVGCYQRLVAAACDRFLPIPAV